MKNCVQDGEVVGLQADPSNPVPLEVRVVRQLPVEALTLNCVLCPASPSLTTWLCSGLLQLCCLLSCVLGEASPLSRQPFILLLLAMCHQPALARLFPLGDPSITASGWQDFQRGTQGMLEALGPTLPCNNALLSLGLGSPVRKRAP